MFKNSTPADTRDWLVRGLDSAVQRTPAGGVSWIPGKSRSSCVR
jgi:hypothetical protein